jgi:hypothetical protein
MPKTFHEVNFEKLKGCAQMAERTLHANPHPNNDQKENVSHALGDLDKCVKSYCEKTPGTEPVLKAYNTAKSEWALVKQDKGDSKKIVAALTIMMNSHYVAPPAPPAAPVAPPRPTSAAPTAPPRPAQAVPVKH